MAAPVGRWRATYTPGEWIVLAGPTSVVVMQPASGKYSALISTLWEEVLGSASLVEMASKLAGYRIDAMPSFGAFFWAEGGMRSLVRGDVKVVDVATDSVVASGEGIQTWTEVGLDGVTRVRVEFPAIGSADSVGANPPLDLPLVVGAVRAASVSLDGSAAAQVFSPQTLSAGPEEQFDSAAVPLEADPDADAEADADAAGGHDAAAVADGQIGPEPEEVGLASDGPMTEPMTDPFPVPVPLPEPTADVPAELDAPAEPEPEPEPDADLRQSMEYGDTELMAPVPSQDSMENGDTQLMAPVPDGPLAAAVSQDSMIMAVVCQYGHASPQNASVCRICGTPIVPQGPQLVPRPPLALLRASNGATEEVDRVVLIGRAPAANASTARDPRLMTVLSPGHDISRTHVEVAPEGWQVVVTDLRSTNGTTLIQPGSGDRSQLPSGEPVPVPLGSVLELGDGVSVLIDFPQ